MQWTNCYGIRQLTRQLKNVMTKESTPLTAVRWSDMFGQSLLSAFGTLYGFASYLLDSGLSRLEV